MPLATGCIVFVDNGLLRKDEFQSVLKRYSDMGLSVHGIDAKEQFYIQLQDVVDPEEKRKVIGRVFIEVFEKEATAYPGVKWLGQGTIYPDVIESISVHGPSVTIKSHHNVGGLPERLKLKIIEPLRMLFKDEVRKVGKALGIPPEILNRHPFPGPGLGIGFLGISHRIKCAHCRKQIPSILSCCKSTGGMIRSGNQERYYYRFNRWVSWAMNAAMKMPLLCGQSIR